MSFAASHVKVTKARFALHRCGCNDCKIGTMGGIDFICSSEIRVVSLPAKIILNEVISTLTRLDEHSSRVAQQMQAGFHGPARRFLLQSTFFGLIFVRWFLWSLRWCKTFQIIAIYPGLCENSCLAWEYQIGLSLEDLFKDASEIVEFSHCFGKGN